MSIIYSVSVSDSILGKIGSAVDKLSPSTKSKFELIVELIKVLVWPTVALLILIVFWSPLQQTASLLPTIIGRSDTISIAGLSIKVSQGLKSKATPDIEFVLSKLSKSGIEHIMEMGESSYWDKASIVSGRDRNEELVKLKLTTEIPQSEIDELNRTQGRDHGYGVRKTELGKQTQAFLQSVVAEFVQQLPAQSVSK